MAAIFGQRALFQEALTFAICPSIKRRCCRLPFAVRSLVLRAAVCGFAHDAAGSFPSEPRLSAAGDGARQLARFEVGPV